jgi:hypothetical protein
MKKKPQRHEHFALVNKDLKEARTVDDWVKYGRNLQQAEWEEFLPDAVELTKIANDLFMSMEETQGNRFTSWIDIEKALLAIANAIARRIGKL